MVAEELLEFYGQMRYLFSFSASSCNTSRCNLLDDFEEIDTEENIEQEDKLRIVNSLVDIATYSSRLARYIQSALRIAKKFGMQYKVCLLIDKLN